MTKNRMFSFVDKKRPNPIGGECYGCTYCYIHGKRGMKNRFKKLSEKYSGDFSLFRRILDKKLVNVIKPVFFCDCIDWLHWKSNNYIISSMLNWFNSYPDIEFLSLTKNPLRYSDIIDSIPDNLILGFTVESNRDYPYISYAPIQSKRIEAMLYIRGLLDLNEMKNKIFISIEPIMEFDFYEFLNSIEKINPTFGVAIGYDNYNNKLEEPLLKNTLVLRKNLIADGFTVYDKTLRKAYREK